MNYQGDYVEAKTKPGNDDIYSPVSISMYQELNSTTTIDTKPNEDSRYLTRTPSPTPSELREMNTGAIDWKTVTSREFWIRKEWICELISI
jgi:hypothetical protein